MQRGCVSTLAASAKMARERSPESEIEAKSDGDRKLLLVVGVCAELVTEPMSAAQQSKLGNDIGRIMPAPSVAITTFPGCKSSFPKAQSKPDGERSGPEPWSRPDAGLGHAGSSMNLERQRLGHPSRRDLADGKREPIGPGAIVVGDKVVNIVTFPLALGRTDAGGPARVTRFSRSVAVATGSPGAEKLARLYGLGRNTMSLGTILLIVLIIILLGGFSGIGGGPFYGTGYYGGGGIGLVLVIVLILVLLGRL
jgi:hypothetical protein